MSLLGYSLHPTNEGIMILQLCDLLAYNETGNIYFIFKYLLGI